VNTVFTTRIAHGEGALVSGWYRHEDGYTHLVVTGLTGGSCDGVIHVYVDGEETTQYLRHYTVGANRHEAVEGSLYDLRFKGGPDQVLVSFQFGAEPLLDVEVPDGEMG